MVNGMNSTLSTKETHAIAADLARCDVMMAIGSKAMKKSARSHRAKCFAAIKAANKADGLDKGQTDAELLAELGV